ncbi:hypothetical protein MAPG_09230 [Magnaporthiopsis poae ATCC 64411]|uniref:C6 zinc finger domain-containing protein n=1 Tax=Magnaporthiopsis poae (strain ATCC 64411 / 73-15) TaxID=644358 RepID=A0A0C4E9E6_MAGP6|nr:hypothetical protein MAPG_09230 [Magnaporthiopsis poae ATCC 64411]
MSKQKRKFHSKSRKGCQMCKQRHIKDGTSEPPAGSGSGSGTQSGSPSESTTALEMALLHRWTSATYLSLCCIEEEHQLLQVLVPQAALRLPFLMDGMLAISALDIAINDDGNKYPTLDVDYPLVAARYYDRGLAAFRKLLVGSPRETLDPESHQAMVIFSCIAGIMNMAMPQFDAGPAVEESSSTTGRTLAAAMIHFDMIHGAGQVVLIALDWLEEGPYPTNARPNWKEDVPRGKSPDVSVKRKGHQRHHQHRRLRNHKEPQSHVQAGHLVPGRVLRPHARPQHERPRHPLAHNGRRRLCGCRAAGRAARHPAAHVLGRHPPPHVSGLLVGRAAWQGAGA